jgi:dynamin 1-like protein
MISDSALTGPLFEDLRTMVTLIDHLRDAGLQNYIKLPRIVTLGVQSSGKSSVIENIVGLDFLPRGEGVVTRRPLELRMVHTASSEKPSAKFEGVSKTLNSFEEVKSTIQRLTDEVAGGRKAIVDDPIILTIYSSTCPDLTLIDLPGITRIPIEDQPHDIEKITKEMAYRYISDPRTIILCVIPANADMSTSEGLQMARTVDKEGVRTLGVITKIDIMDKGTNARRMLLGQEVPLRLGYVGMKNRSQQDIQRSVPVASALTEEKTYFSTHEIYSALPQHLLGTECLTHRLSKVMMHHIRHFLPELMLDVQQRTRECDERFIELGPPTPSLPQEKVQLLWTMVTNFFEIFKNNIRGKYDRRTSSRIAKDLQGGLQIKQSFHKLLKEFTGDYTATRDYSDADIERAILVHEGDSIPGFPSADVFLYLIHPQLEKLHDPVFECLYEIGSLLENLAQTIIERLFYRFPSLVSEICEVVSSVLRDERDKCKEIVQSIIEAEESYVFTNDTEYLLTHVDIVAKGDVKGNVQFVQEVRHRIDLYFRLVIRNIRDSVPKLIGNFLVRKSMDRLQLELFEKVNRDTSIQDLLVEPEHIAMERDKVNSQLRILKEAQKILRREAGIAAEPLESDGQYLVREEAKESGRQRTDKVMAERKSNLEVKEVVDSRTSLFGDLQRKAAKDKSIL